MAHGWVAAPHRWNQCSIRVVVLANFAAPVVSHAWVIRASSSYLKCFITDQARAGGRRSPHGAATSSCDATWMSRSSRP
jgi:hypothetical protein